MHPILNLISKSDLEWGLEFKDSNANLITVDLNQNQNHSVNSNLNQKHNLNAHQNLKKETKSESIYKAESK